MVHKPPRLFYKLRKLILIKVTSHTSARSIQLHFFQIVVQKSVQELRKRNGLIYDRLQVT